MKVEKPEDPGLKEEETEAFGPAGQFLCGLLLGHTMAPALVKGPKTGWTYYGHRCSLCGLEKING